MFYRKSEMEILCDTLLKLVDKHDKAVKAYGILGATPHQKAIDIIMKRIESDLSKPIIGVEAKVKTTAKRLFDGSKAEIKRFSGVKKKKPMIEVVHGASDDAKPVDDVVLNEKLNQVDEIVNSPDPQEEKKDIPSTPAGVVTPDNIDKMSDQLYT